MTQPLESSRRRRPRPLSRRGLMAAAMATTSLSTLIGNRTQAATARPNLILIVLDDVGFSDLGCFGGEIHTPNIDALAAGGLRYNRFDSKAICSSTRAALLTGRNNQTVGMADITDVGAKVGGPWTKNSGYIPQNAEMLPAALKRAGYATWAVGKWHLTPSYELGPDAPRTTWPRHRGFDYFYGFTKGWTDQYHPNLVENDQAIPTPTTPGYHFSADIVDKSISLIERQQASAPTQPFFLYLAFGAAHAPLQAPRSFIDHYAGVYEKGWDAIRLERFARMKRMGVIPKDTVLPPANPGDRAWADLSQDEKIVFARFMAVYAGMLEHADAQIGRLMEHLKARGLGQDTLIMVLSDNGAASEAGQTGSFNGLYRPNTLTPAQERARLDELGTDKTQSEYPRPWAMASDTPLRRYKAWPYLGGVRTPLLVSWPAVIKDGGAIRRQFVDVIDLAPTLLQAAGGGFATEVAGVRQIPVAGKSIAATFANPSAPAARTVQFFELRGNRAIVQGDWRAVAMHKCGTTADQDHWMLFNVAVDFSESTDLAAKYPAKLKELQQLWAAEAQKYSLPPIGPYSIPLCYFGGYNDDFPPGPQRP